MKFSLRSLILAVLAIGSAWAWRTNWASWEHVWSHRAGYDLKMTFTSDGKELKVFHGARPEWLSIDVASGQYRFFTAEHEGQAMFLCHSPDLAYVAYRRQGQLCIYPLSDPGNPRIAERDWNIDHGTFSNDCSLFVGLDIAAFRLWDWRFASEEIKSRQDFAMTMSFSIDDRLLCVARGGGEIGIYETKGMKPLLGFQGMDEVMESLRFCNKGRYLLGIDQISRVRFWRTNDGKVIYTQREPRLHNNVPIPVVAVDDSFCVLVVGHGQPVVVSFESLKERSFDSLRDGTILKLALQCDSKVLVAALNNGDLAFWDVPSGKLLSVLQTDHEYYWDMRFSPDGRHLALLDHNNRIHLYRQRHRRYGRAWLYPEVWITFMALFGLVWSLRRDERTFGRAPTVAKNM